MSSERFPLCFPPREKILRLLARALEVLCWGARLQVPGAGPARVHAGCTHSNLGRSVHSSRGCSNVNYIRCHRSGLSARCIS